MYTDGAKKYVADKCGAYWLLDEIAILQRYEKRLAGEQFQVWKLTVSSDCTATLVCEDGNGSRFSAKIEFTDFPLPSLSLWCVNNTILLPSEY